MSARSTSAAITRRIVNRAAALFHQNPVAVSLTKPNHPAHLGVRKNAPTHEVGDGSKAAPEMHSDFSFCQPLDWLS